MDATFVQLVTGNDQGAPTDIKAAVAARFLAIRDTLKQRPGLDADQWSNRHIYDGNRCKPENLGWRFIQNVGLSRLKTAPGTSIGGCPGMNLPDPTVEKIMAGDFDAAIEATWHDAASSEYWYAYEKQWD